MSTRSTIQAKGVGEVMPRIPGSRLRSAALIATLMGVVIFGSPPPASAASVASLVWVNAPSPLGALIPGGEYSNAGDAFFQDVSCSTPKFCAAISSDGNFYSPTYSIEVWNGKRWSASARSAIYSGGTLAAISCKGAKFCMAVGAFNGGPFSEMWNGSDWSTTTISDPESIQLTDVTCPSTIACFAVGNTSGSPTHQTVVESWNGTNWSRLTTPNLGTDSNDLIGISCSTKTFCMAVGTHVGSANTPQPLSERWNGSSWTLISVPSPDPNNRSNLAGVSCVSKLFCMAIGTAPGPTLAETWNGTVWTIAASTAAPGPDYTDSFIGVSCNSTTSCAAAVASQGPAIGASYGYVTVWDGSNWSDVGARTAVGLSAISCAAGKLCAVVGGDQYFQGGQVALMGTS